MNMKRIPLILLMALVLACGMVRTAHAKDLVKVTIVGPGPTRSRTLNFITVLVLARKLSQRMSITIIRRRVRSRVISIMPT